MFDSYRAQKTIDDGFCYKGFAPTEQLNYYDYGNDACKMPNKVLNV